MAKVKASVEKPPANLSREQMRSAIPKIARRIQELKGFDIDAIVDRYDPRISALSKKIDETLVDTLGAETLDYHRHQLSSLDHGPHVVGGISLHEAKEGIHEGFQNAIVKLQTVIDIFQEKIDDSPESPSIKASRTLRESNLHPELMKNVAKLFDDGHYSNAIEDACKILEAFVKMRSMRFELSGTDLMNTVFSAKNPVLKFNELKDDTEKSEQQGMMHLYAGAMLAFRNPRAHSIKTDEPENAMDVLLFINLLLKSLDNTTK